MELLDLYGDDIVAEAIDRALQRGTPRADSVAYLIEKHHRHTPEELGPRPRWGRPEIDGLHVHQHNLEDYDDL